MKIKTGILSGLALSAAGFLFLSAPNDDQNRRERLRTFRVVRFAHRGLHDKDSAENTMTSFKKAVEAGCGIELDVRLSADGVPVIFHDESTGRLCERDLIVGETAFEELRSLKIGKNGERIPTLKEVLDLIGTKVPLIIEIKNGHGVRPICEAVMKDLRFFPGFFCVQSFSPFILKWFADHEPYILRGQLSFDFFAPRHEREESFPVKFGATYLLENVISRPDYVAYNIRDFRKLSLKISRRFFDTPLALWTIRGEKDLSLADRENAIVIFEKIAPENEYPGGTK